MGELKATEPVSKRNNKNSMPNKIKLAIVFFISIFAMSLFFVLKLAKTIEDKINAKLNEGFWELPAQVYSKSYAIKVGHEIRNDKLSRLLESARYRNTNNVVNPGEFHIKKNTLTIYLRAFSSYDYSSNQKRVEVFFKDDVVAKINDIDSGSSIGEVVIEPSLIDVIYSPGDEQRIYLPLNDFPKEMIKILISTEDKGFYHHYGISPLSIIRALYSNIKAGRNIQGGSTLTQQVVKNMFLSNDRTMKRKIIEALMAIMLEMKLSKDKILELYLNEIYLGQNGSFGIHGFPLASIYYFGRPVNELSLDQQALLIGMVKGASLYNPWSNPSIAISRRNIVLKISEMNGVITKSNYSYLVKKDLNIKPKGTAFTKHPSFINMLRKEIRENKNIRINELSGSKIFSTFDPISQYDAEMTVIETMPILDKKTRIKDLQSAMVVVDRKNGELLAVIGDRNVEYNGFNRASDSRRQVGSLIKPAVYLAALSDPKDFGLNTLIEDQPIHINIGNTSWSPRNPTRTYRGKVFLLDALAYSINVSTVNIGMSIGLDKVADTLKLIGVPENRIAKNPSMLLGTLDMSPIELAEAIQTIANLGVHNGIHTLVSIQNKFGDEIYRRPDIKEQVVSNQAAWLTMYAMQESVRSGTSKKLRVGFESYTLAGKTGSSSGLRDSWFSGIDENKVVLTWIGRDNNQSTNLWGASGSLLLTKEFFIRNGVEKLKLVQPKDIYLMDVNTHGDFICNKENTYNSNIYIRKVPIWGKSITEICKTPSQFLPVSTNKAYSDEVLDSIF